MPQPSLRGPRRLAGVDWNKARIRQVSESMLALAAAPGGFTHAQPAARVHEDHRSQRPDYSSRSAAYDTAKLRGKNLVGKIAGTRRLKLTCNGVRLLCGLLNLREKVIRPVLAGLQKQGPGRHPKRGALDEHYHRLRTQMLQTFHTLHLAA